MPLSFFIRVEGGAIIMQDEALARKVWLYKSFGHISDEYFSLGVNGKNSEFHAAMGLCNLARVTRFIEQRRALAELYRHELAGLSLQFPEPTENSLQYNYSYFPILFDAESRLLRVKEALAAQTVNTRRYFFPSLNKLPYNTGAPCPVSEDVSRRVLCLPFYQELTVEQVRWISQLIRNFYG